jgi:hypothetical protein
MAFLPMETVGQEKRTMRAVSAISAHQQILLPTFYIQRAYHLGG